MALLDTLILGYLGRAKYFATAEQLLRESKELHALYEGLANKTNLDDRIQGLTLEELLKEWNEADRTNQSNGLAERHSIDSMSSIKELTNEYNSVQEVRLQLASTKGAQSKRDAGVQARLKSEEPRRRQPKTKDNGCSPQPRQESREFVMQTIECQMMERANSPIHTTSSPSSNPEWSTATVGKKVAASTQTEEWQPPMKTAGRSSQQGRSIKHAGVQTTEEAPRKKMKNRGCSPRPQPQARECGTQTSSSNGASDRACSSIFASRAAQVNEASTQTDAGLLRSATRGRASTPTFILSHGASTSKRREERRVENISSPVSAALSTLTSPVRAHSNPSPTSSHLLHGSRKAKGPLSLQQRLKSTLLGPTTVQRIVHAANAEHPTSVPAASAHAPCIEEESRSRLSFVDEIDEEAPSLERLMDYFPTVQDFLANYEVELDPDWFADFQDDDDVEVGKSSDATYGDEQNQDPTFMAEEASEVAGNRPSSEAVSTPRVSAAKDGEHAKSGSCEGVVPSFQQPVAAQKPVKWCLKAVSPASLPSVFNRSKSSAKNPLSITPKSSEQSTIPLIPLDHPTTSGQGAGCCDPRLQHLGGRAKVTTPRAIPPNSNASTPTFSNDENTPASPTFPAPNREKPHDWTARQREINMRMKEIIPNMILSSPSSFEDDLRRGSGRWMAEMVSQEPSSSSGLSECTSGVGKSSQNGQRTKQDNSLNKHAAGDGEVRPKGQKRKANEPFEFCVVASPMDPMFFENGRNVIGSTGASANIPSPKKANKPEKAAKDRTGTARAADKSKSGKSNSREENQHRSSSPRANLTTSSSCAATTDENKREIKLKRNSKEAAKGTGFREAAHSRERSRSPHNRHRRVQTAESVVHHHYHNIPNKLTEEWSILRENLKKPEEKDARGKSSHRRTHSPERDAHKSPHKHHRRKSKDSEERIRRSSSKSRVRTPVKPGGASGEREEGELSLSPICYDSQSPNKVHKRTSFSSQSSPQKVKVDRSREKNTEPREREDRDHHIKKKRRRSKEE